MPEILHRIGVNAPIAQVYGALTTSQGISSWWTRKVEGTAQDMWRGIQYLKESH